MGGISYLIISTKNGLSMENAEGICYTFMYRTKMGGICMEQSTGYKIVLTGGGTAGHVTPNIALLPQIGRAHV